MSKDIGMEIMRVARVLVGDDRSAMRKFIEVELREEVEGMEFEVRVDFKGRWAGKYYPESMDGPAEYPEFETEDEDMDIKNHIRKINIPDLRASVCDELVSSGVTEADADELVDSGEFDRYLNQIMVGNKWEVEEVEVRLPKNHRVSIDLGLKLRRSGDWILVEAIGDVEDVMVKVKDEAADWYPMADDFYPPDRD